MERQTALAYPLLGFHLMENPDQPTLGIFLVHTEKAQPDAFAVTREILEELAAAFLRFAERLPRKTDLS